MATTLDLTRGQILDFRQRVGSLGERLPFSRDSLRQAAWAGLQDSMPRAALLSIHARLGGTSPDAWEDPCLVQLWGPRFSVYVVEERDLAVFSRGRLPIDEAERQQAEELAARMAGFLGGGRMPYDEVARGLGVHHNQLRYAAPTGRVLMRWEGARRPVIWTVPAPDVDARDARLELARRYLHVFGPSTPDAFAGWAGVTARAGASTFDALRGSLTPVRTPIGDSSILTSDEEAFLADPGPVAPARLLPSGDAYYLLWGADRELLVESPSHRRELWTSRVWPGAVLVEGEIVGTWRRAQHRVTVRPWRRLAPGARAAVESEAASLSLPGVDRDVAVRWDD